MHIEEHSQESLTITNFIRRGQSGKVLATHSNLRIDVIPDGDSYGLRVSCENLPWPRDYTEGERDEMDVPRI